MHYKLPGKFEMYAGVAYKTSAVSDRNRTVTVPMGEPWRLGTGVTSALDTSKQLSGERLSGQYDAAWIQTLTGKATWRF